MQDLPSLARLHHEPDNDLVGHLFGKPLQHPECALGMKVLAMEFRV